MATAIATEGRIKDLLIGFEEMFGEDYDPDITLGEMTALMAVADKLDDSASVEHEIARELSLMTNDNTALEAYYSAIPPFKKKQIAQESVYEAVKDSVRRGIDKLIEFLKRALAWLRGLIPGQGITERKVKQLDSAIKEFKEHTFSHAIRDQALRRQAEKYAKESLAQTYSQKLSPIHWDILDRGDRNTSIHTLSNVLLKENPVNKLTEFADQIYQVFEALSKQAESLDAKQGADISDFKETVMQRLGDAFAQPVHQVSIKLEHGLMSVKKLTGTLKDSENRLLDVNVSILIEMIDKRLHDFDYHTVARQAMVASNQLEKVIRQLTDYQKELTANKPMGVAQPAMAQLRRAYFAALMELLSLSKQCMMAYKLISDQFVSTIQLFIICQEYFMGVYRRMLEESTTLESSEITEISHILDKMKTSNNVLREFF